MKNLKKISAYILIFALIFSSFHFTAFGEPIETQIQTLTVLDSNSTTPLPNRFRVMNSLNISGSAQFTKEQLKNIKSKLNKNSLFIIDLRQESHGFVNNIAFSYYSPQEILNKGLTSKQVLDKESQQLSSISIGSEMPIYNKKGDILQKVMVSEINSEGNLCKDLNVNYIRLAVQDGSIPTPEVVDTFINLVKIKPKDSHMHFHCLAGEGRTTTFMSMFQMMNNTSNISLENILKDQIDLGGIVLTDSKTRAEFLNDFYNYTQNNIKNNFSIPYSTWIKTNKNKVSQTSHGLPYFLLNL